MQFLKKQLSQFVPDPKADLRARRARVQKFWNRIKNYCLDSASLLVPSLRADDTTLRVFYDLGREPITFDFLFFLAAADLERRARGLAAIQVMFVPGERGGFREEWPDYERIVDRESRRWRISNLLLPSLQLLPSCTGHVFCNSRRQADLVARLANHVYPENYKSKSPDTQGYAVTAYRELMAAGRAGKQGCVLNGGEQARRYADQWLVPRAHGRKVVTITLREYGYHEERNSNVTAWTAFARGLDPKEYFAVFVRDLETAMAPTTGLFAGLTIFEGAPLNLELRMALYERSYLNLGSSNGPMGLCILSETTPYLMFKILTPGVPQTTVEWLTNLGIEIGAERYPFASPVQKLVWEEDDLDVIRREFKTMCEALERRGGEHLYGEAVEGPPEPISERSS
ncbi:MAG: hypothetical protein IID53_04980 [Proteobacteria bacterium]|nr:hypothetical protein [Pseudomonadota bacterium]